MDDTANSAPSVDNGPGIQEVKPIQYEQDGIPLHVSRRIDPEAVLPAHLQACSIEQDIWRRLKSHPVPSPDITRDALRSDARTSDLFNRVLLAASDRETEILLHNQTRVFKEILGRTLESIWRFMGESWAPRTWGHRSMIEAFPSTEPSPTNSLSHLAQVTANTSAPLEPAPAAMSTPVAPSSSYTSATTIGPLGTGTPSPTASQPSRPAARKRPTAWKGIIAWLLTPKYLVLILTAIFVLTSSYFKMQVENMKSAITSYKEAADASQQLREQLGQAIGSAKTERDRLTDQIGRVTLESATLRNNVHERDTRLEGVRAQLTAADERIKDLREQLKKHQEKQADDVKTMQSQRDAMQGERDQANQKVASLDAKVKGLEDARDAVKKIGDERAAIIRDLQNQISTFQTANEGLLNRNAELEQSRTLLKFAKTYIYNTGNEIRSIWGIDKGNMEKYLKEYEAAEKTVTEVNN